MLLFRSVFVGSPVALAFVAGLVPSVTAAPWWPMHYVLGAIPPEQMSSIATTQPGFTSTIKPVTSTSILSSAAPDITGTAESVPVGSNGSADALIKQTNSATIFEHASATSILFGSTILALCLAL